MCGGGGEDVGWVRERDRREVFGGLDLTAGDVYCPYPWTSGGFVPGGDDRAVGESDSGGD